MRRGGLGLTFWIWLSGGVAAGVRDEGRTATGVPFSLAHLQTCTPLLVPSAMQIKCTASGLSFKVATLPSGERDAISLANCVGCRRSALKRIAGAFKLVVQKCSRGGLSRVCARAGVYGAARCQQQRISPGRA